MKTQILAIIKKELSSYFGSPLALIFLGTFLAAVLFIFFTVETFFVRGVADVRPLFRWMPVLLIFLLAAMTMRQWSEEQRSGTQELLLTLPVKPLYLVLGKFLSVMAVIAVALALTLPLPISVSFMGSLDWGPVIGGYAAALLMAAAYAAIGLFVSSRTDNQIVALISTVLLGGLFYLLGSRGVTDFVGGSVSQLLWSLGTGSRFESIQRGVIDLRDLVYYLSLTGFFLMLNTISLDSVRWSIHQREYRRRLLKTALLLGVNLILLNLWLAPLHGLRLDLTAQKEYSLSQTTKDMFDNLQEPLLIRAYVSEKTHPLLAPLVPRVRDMLREYEIASEGRVTAEMVDPIDDAEIETEANQTYGIRPTPFQVSDRREASVINSYFDILVRYGDQTVILNFQDLIQVDAPPSGSIDIQLRNLEYDLTRAVKKVLFGFQSVDAVLAAMDQPVTLTLYLTPGSLPENMLTMEASISGVARQIQESSKGKFIYQVVDLDDPNSPVSRQTMVEQYGLQPFPVSFFSAESYYAHMILQNGDTLHLLYPPADLSEGAIRTTIESVLKQTTSGFLKVAGIWTPPSLPPDSQYGTPQTFTSYTLIREQLAQEYTVRDVDLSSGQAPPDLDVLLILSPADLTEIELFAIDQYLMRGGAVVMAVSSAQVAADQFSGSLYLQPVNTGVTDWLANYGIQLSGSLVMDQQNQPFPVAVTRDAGGFQVREIQAVDYPYFVDVRPDGMEEGSPIAANLPAVTMNWVSPVELNLEKVGDLESAVLLRSSEASWLQSGTEIQPDFQAYPDQGFAPGGEMRAYPLAVSLQGSFQSYFKDKDSPFAALAAAPVEGAAGTPPAADPPPPVGTITSSPESSRLLVIGSSTFVEDLTLNISSSLIQDRYLSNLQFMQNAVDWSVEDLDLLAIRSRGSISRVLSPMTDSQQSFWEAANYVIALLALLAIYYTWRVRGQNELPMELLPMKSEENA